MTYRFSILSILLLISLTLISCSQTPKTRFAANSLEIVREGRSVLDENSNIRLIGSASGIATQFTGNKVTLFVTNETRENMQNYFVVNLDDKYMGRFKIVGNEETSFEFEATQNKPSHEIKLIKATEASNGYLIFNGISCDTLLSVKQDNQLSIEFIGDSITCGMGVDHDEIACHTDQWYDQHNAYLAYGPTVARALNANFMLSSVSGIGMYRNWNGVGPVMPEVYENMYLNADNSKPWDFSKFSPDLVSICLGTNDLSDGDGVNERLPFSEEEFTSNYINFVETLYSKYPNVQIALLTSPMVSGENGNTLIRCLNKVKDHFSESDNPSIAIFEFDGVTPHGCDDHPDEGDQAKMAEQLIPFYKSLLNL